MTSSNSSKKRCNVPAAQPPPCDPAQLNQILKWILSGATESDIIEAAHTAWPDVDHRPLLLRATETLAARADFNPRVLFGWCLEATRDLYRRMVEIGDFTGALRAAKQLHDFARTNRWIAKDDEIEEH